MTPKFKKGTRIWQVINKHWSLETGEKFMYVDISFLKHYSIFPSFGLAFGVLDKHKRMSSLTSTGFLSSNQEAVKCGNDRYEILSSVKSDAEKDLKNEAHLAD